MNIRSTNILAAALLAFALALGIHTVRAELPKPTPEHHKLSAFVGEWTYSGEYFASPLGSAGKYKGKESGKMTLGGFYFESRWEEQVEGAGTGRGIVVVGYDPAKKVYVDHTFGADGSYSSAVSTVDGSVWTALGTASDPAGRTYKIRVVRTLSKGGKVLEIKAEYSPDDGKSWKPWWAQTGKK